MDMNIVCLDLEGVLVPEIWVAFAEETGIPELKKTTRDEPDYDKLMKWRLGILKEHGLGLKEIQETIAKIDPMPGAKEFLDELRSMTQVIIISDTFTQFAAPLMKKLGWPTIFCNSLEVAENGEITGYRMRVENSKYSTVKALQSIGFETIASGDSHNDLGMIKASKAGFLFKSTEQIKKDNPELPAYETYDELMEAIKKAFITNFSHVNYSAPHSQNRIFDAFLLLMWLLRQRNFQNYAHSCKHDSQIMKIALALNSYIFVSPSPAHTT